MKRPSKELNKKQKQKQKKLLRSKGTTVVEEDGRE